MWIPMPMFLLQRSRPTRRGGWNSGWNSETALVLGDQVRRAKTDGLIDGFFYSSVSSDYLSAMIDAL